MLGTAKYYRRSNILCEILGKRINEVLGTAKLYRRSNILCMMLCKKINEVLGTAKFSCRANISLEDLQAESKQRTCYVQESMLLCPIEGLRQEFSENLVWPRF